MAYEQKPNTGSLFKNDRREKDSHPHAKGTALIGGVEYWVSAWTKDGAKGKFQSLAFTPKDEQQKPHDDPRAARRVELDDEVPFAPEFR